MKKLFEDSSEQAIVLCFAIPSFIMLFTVLCVFNYNYTIEATIVAQEIRICSNQCSKNGDIQSIGKFRNNKTQCTCENGAVFNNDEPIYTQE